MKIGEPSKIYIELMKGWELPLSLIGGTREMRQKHAEFLPKWPRETDKGYETRVKQSTLYNAFKRTMRVLSAKPFAKPITITDVDARLADLETDIDRNDLTLTQFARQELNDLLTFGLAYFLVDMPKVKENATQADVTTNNIHPYFCRVRPDTLISWSFDKTETGEVYLSEIQIRGEEIDNDNVEWVIIFKWTPQEIEVFRAKKPGPGVSDTIFESVDKRPNPLNYIPLVVCYADVTKRGEMQADSPLEDLAYLNLRHYQSQSEQDTSLRFARVPMLHFAGFEEKELETTIAVNNAFVSRNPSATVKWVETTGNALNVGIDDLEAIEARMDVMGADLLIQRTGSPTATAKAIDTAEKVSDLQAMVMSLESALKEGYEIAADWAKITESKIELSIDKNFGMSLKDAAELDFLLKSRIAGEITRDSFLKEVSRRGIIDNLDVEEEMNKLKVEERNNVPALPQQPPPSTFAFPPAQT